MNIKIQGINLNLTPGLRDFVQQKMSDSLRALGSVNKESIKMVIELEHTTNRYLNAKDREQKYRAEATLWLPGHTLRVEESAMDIEQAVVQLKHTLTRDIRKWREQLIENRRLGARQMKHLSLEDDQLPAPEKTDAWVDEWNDEGIEFTREDVSNKEIEVDDWEDDEIDERDLV